MPNPVGEPLSEIEHFQTTWSLYRFWTVNLKNQESAEEVLYEQDADGTTAYGLPTLSSSGEEIPGDVSIHTMIAFPDGDVLAATIRQYRMAINNCWKKDNYYLPSRGEIEEEVKDILSQV
jgi:hypothetical protein